jgi:hypothetical protein
MKSIVNSISNLKGVHYACIYHNGKQLASTFPEGEASLARAHEIIDQIFTALLSIERSYNEIYFSFGDNFLAAFLMHDNHIALLLTEKKINFPLINMGVKSASTKIRLKSEAEKSRYSATLSSISHSTSVSNSGINPDIEPILEKLSTKMVYFLGPAAPLVLEDCLKQWKEKYIQSKENLPHLIELIQKELDSEGEKNEFYIATNIMINKQ